MSKQLKLRRGTTVQHASFTGGEGEITVDTTRDTAVVHDGSTVGGHPLLKDSDYRTSTTGSAKLPAGTTAERDGSPVTGYMRFNSTLSKFEGYNGSAWSLVGATDGQDVNFTQSGTGATERTVTSKLRDVVDAADFNVDMTGASDAAAAFQNAVNACANGKVLKIRGSIRLDSSVTLPDTIGGIEGDGMRKTVITYTRDQQVGEDGWAASAIKLRNGTGATFEKFTVQYTGTFYVAGQSYFGFVSGLYIVDSDDTLVDRVEATGFNVGGVSFTAISRGSTNLCKRNKVTRSWLHHNRVAGCLFQWQEQFVFDNNLIAYNGHVADGGTGYGVAAGSGTQNKNVIYSNNISDHNYRKGFDVHDGDGYTIVNNRSIGDRIFPLSVENDNWPLNSLTIANNVFEIDPSFYLASDDDQPSGTYSSKQVISVYINPYNSGTAPNSIPNISITGNQIKNLGCDDASHTLTGIYVSLNATSAGVLTIADNHIRGTRLTIGMHIARGDNGGPLAIDIHDNTIRTGAITGNGILINPNDVGAVGARGHTNIHNNYFDAPSCTSSVIGVADGLTELRVNNNAIGITSRSYPAIEVGTHINTEVLINDNSITTSSDTNTACIYYGQNVVFGSGNTYNNAPLALPNRVSYLGGANIKTPSTLKSLTASTLTPVARIARQYNISLYVVKWSAFRNTSGPAAVYAAGGVFTFLCGFSDNLQGVVSTITTLSNHAAKNGFSTDLSITWSTDVNVALPWLGRLLATASADCSLYFEMEQVSVMERSTSHLNPLL